MKESRKEFIKKAHSAACSEWKTNIEKEFPKLFKKSALVVGKWYKEAGCLFNYQYGLNIYGFFSDGVWTDRGWSWYDTVSTPATDKEVEEALIKEAKRRGFKEDANIGNTSNKIVGTAKGDLYFEFKDNVLYLVNCVFNDGTSNSTWEIFNKGKWATLIETITKEQAEKELGKTILN